MDEIQVIGALDTFNARLRGELRPVIEEAMAEVAAAVPARTQQLAALAAEIISTYGETTAGYSSYVAADQIARWRKTLAGDDG